MLVNSRKAAWAEAGRLFPTTANIYKVAMDIAEHSADQPPVESIMFLLKREAVMTYYSIC